MDILKEEMEKIFFDLGFTYKVVGKEKRRYLVYNNCYCQITYLRSRNAFVIECANDKIEAENGVLEDSDWYYLDEGKDNLLRRLKEDLLAYYINES